MAVPPAPTMLRAEAVAGNRDHRLDRPLSYGSRHHDESGRLILKPHRDHFRGTQPHPPAPHPPRPRLSGDAPRARVRGPGEQAADLSPRNAGPPLKRRSDPENHEHTSLVGPMLGGHPTKRLKREYGSACALEVKERGLLNDAIVKVLYVDGSSRPTHRFAAGAAVAWRNPDGDWDGRAYPFDCYDNSDIETYGIYRAAKLARDAEFSKGVQRVIILSDSKVALVRIENGQRNGKSSYNYVKAILNDVAGLEKDGIQVNLGWVAGHGDCAGNNVADEIAKYASTQALNGEKTTRSIEYRDKAKLKRIAGYADAGRKRTRAKLAAAEMAEQQTHVPLDLRELASDARKDAEPNFDRDKPVASNSEHSKSDEAAVEIAAPTETVGPREEDEDEKQGRTGVMTGGLNRDGIKAWKATGNTNLLGRFELALADEEVQQAVRQET